MREQHGTLWHLPNYINNYSFHILRQNTIKDQTKIPTHSLISTYIYTPTHTYIHICFNPRNTVVVARMALQKSNNKDPRLVLSRDAKPRLKWTPELHQRFVDAIAQLGGADSECSLLHPLSTYIYILQNQDLFFFMIQFIIDHIILQRLHRNHWWERWTFMASLCTTSRAICRYVCFKPITFGMELALMSNWSTFSISTKILS